MEEIKISGIWNIENKQYKGDVYILKNKKMIRLMIQYVDTLNPFWDEEIFPQKIDLIYGTSFINDIPITLLDCTTLRKNSNMSTGIKSILIDCKFCIYGLLFKKNENVKFNSIRVKLTNSLEWSGLGGFSLLRESKDTPINLKYKFKNKILYKINNNIKLEFIPWLGKQNYSLKSEKIILEQFMTVKLSYIKLEQFKDIMNQFNKVIQLIELSTNQKIEISKIEGFKNTLFYKIPQTNQKILNAYRIYYADEEEMDLKDIELIQKDNKSICDLNDIVGINGLDNWFKKFDDLKPIVELYNKKFEYELNLEQEFLNVVQALEFYHTRFVVEDLNEFKQKVEKHYKTQPELIKNIYDKAQNSANYIILKNRLIDLIFNSNILFFFNKTINFLNLVKSVVDTRHYYTHYNTSKKYKALKDTELSITTIILNSLLEYFILKEIGFEEQFLDKLIRNRLNLVKKSVIPYSEQKNIQLYERVNLITSIKNISQNICKECNLGNYIDEEIIKDNEKDLNFYLNTDKGKFKIRIFSNLKSDDDCNKIIKEDKTFLVHTKKQFYELIYFNESYRIIIYKFN